MLLLQVQSAEEQLRSKDNIITEYKQITKDLSQKLNDKDQVTSPEQRLLGKSFIFS